MKVYLKKNQFVFYFSVPEFVAASKPIVDGNITAGVYIINWANSFILNGELIEYQLVENGDKVYSGIATVVERRLDAASKFCHKMLGKGEGARERNICKKLGKQVLYLMENVLSINWLKMRTKVYSGIATVVERRLDAASKFYQNAWERGGEGAKERDIYKKLGKQVYT